MALGVTSQVLVFIRTGPFRQTPQYSRSLVVPLRRPTADMAAITSASVMGLRAIFKPDFDYAKAGVMLLDIGSSKLEEFELYLNAADTSAGARATPRNWTTKQELHTPAYTTRWEDMPVVRA